LQIRARAIVPIHAGAAEFQDLSREVQERLAVVFILRVELPGTRSLFPAQEAIGRHSAARRSALRGAGHRQASATSGERVAPAPALPPPPATPQAHAPDQ